MAVVVARLPSRRRRWRQRSPQLLALVKHLKLHSAQHGPADDVQEDQLALRPHWRDIYRGALVTVRSSDFIAAGIAYAPLMVHCRKQCRKLYLSTCAAVSSASPMIVSFAYFARYERWELCWSLIPLSRGAGVRPICAAAIWWVQYLRARCHT